MIKYCTACNDETIKLLKLDVERKEIIELLVIVRSQIQQIKFNSVTKQIEIELITGKDIIITNMHYYDSLLNYFTPRFEWNEIA